MHRGAREARCLQYVCRRVAAHTCSWTRVLPAIRNRNRRQDCGCRKENACAEEKKRRSGPASALTRRGKSTRTVPSLWKEGNLTPLLVGGDCIALMACVLFLVTLTPRRGRTKIVPGSVLIANAMRRSRFGSRVFFRPGAVLLLLAWSAPASAFIPSSEHDALVAIYNATGGPNWTNHTGWNGKPRTECGWFGVTCDAAGDHVIQLSLGSNNLTGALPALSGLPALGIVSLSSNQLTALPPDLGSLSALAYFYADQNQITGTLPDLSGLQNLIIFNVGSNQLGGALPSLPPGLQGFFVNLNQFTGSIPSSLQFASGLQTYNVQFNRLTGPVPNVLGGLFALQHFLVAGNRLSGILPDVPIVNGLQNAGSALCPNLFEPSYDPSWDAATGEVPWWTDCAIFFDGFDF